MQFPIVLGVSARHAHLCREHMDILFGEGSELHVKKPIGQPGQFASEEQITMVTPKDSMKLRIIGPLRPETQIELSLTDARKVGLDAPIRNSGDIAGSAGAKLIGPKGELELKEGIIIAARHVHLYPETAEKYGVEIEEIRPKISIVQVARTYGIPFVSKIMSGGLSDWQKKGIPLSIADEYDQAEDKVAKRRELKERYPKCESVINFLCCCNSAGEPRPNIQLVINSSKYMRDFIGEYPPDFKISAKCCDYCKKQSAHAAQKGYDMIVTGERRAEGGMRSVPRKDNTSLCFTETSSGKYRLRPLYYVTDIDKAWYKDYYGIRYSDAYEVYGLTRTGCYDEVYYKFLDFVTTQRTAAVEKRAEKLSKYRPNRRQRRNKKT